MAYIGGLKSVRSSGRFGCTPGGWGAGIDRSASRTGPATRRKIAPGRGTLLAEFRRHCDSIDVGVMGIRLPSSDRGAAGYGLPLKGVAGGGIMRQCKRPILGSPAGK